MKKIKEWFKLFKQDPLFLRRWDMDFYTQNPRRQNRLSIQIGAASNRYPFGPTPSTFTQEMYLGAIPSYGSSQNYPVKIEPHSSAKERLIANGIGNTGFPVQLTEASFNFIRNALQTLFQQGIALYEIVYAKNQSGDIESFTLEWVSPRHIYKFFNNYYQVILWPEARASRVKVQIIKIPKDKIVQIDFPEEYGGKRRIERILKRLWFLGKEVIPEFQMKAMEKSEETGFDLPKYNLGKYIEIEKVTKSLGWNYGQADNATEYYYMLRLLKQKKLGVALRKEILYKLNQALNGSHLNLGVNLIIENLPTLDSIEEQEKLLKTGNVSFTEIFHATNF